MQLTDEERAFSDGSCGAAVALSMRIVTEMGRILGADRLTPIGSAHIDGCLYHGPAGVLFAERLVAGRGRVAVPATLNVGAVDLQRPDRILLDATERDLARRLMRAYEALGCAPTWTCAPYQAGHRPRAGEDIAWAESNAVVFVNSVLGARTNRYGDFMDIACALTGRAPYYGLHVPRNRRAVLVADVGGISDALKVEDSFFPVLGAWLGREAGEAIAVIDGLPATTTEDQLKALGAAAASTGSVALFHVAGVTPEAPTLDAALQGETPAAVIVATPAMLRAARDRLSTVAGETLDVIALGSPHFSNDEFLQLERQLAGRPARIPIYACTGRHVADELTRSGRAATLAGQGVEIVVDTCVVATPILTGKRGGVLMTNSGKFAHYGPSNTGYEAVYGSLADCVESAVAGRVTRDERLWR
jgi:predicted aconitase